MADPVPVAFWKGLRLGDYLHGPMGCKVQVANPSAMAPTLFGDAAALQDRGASAHYLWQMEAVLQKAHGTAGPSEDARGFRRRAAAFAAGVMAAAGFGNQFTARGTLVVIGSESDDDRTAPGTISPGSNVTIPLNAAYGTAVEIGLDLAYLEDPASPGIIQELAAINTYSPGVPAIRVDAVQFSYASGARAALVHLAVEDVFLAQGVDIPGTAPGTDQAVQRIALEFGGLEDAKPLTTYP